MEVTVNCFVMDRELDRLGYTVGFNDEINCFAVSFQDDPAFIYLMPAEQLEAIPKPEWLA